MAQEDLRKEGVGDDKLELCGQGLRIYTKEYLELGYADMGTQCFVWHLPALQEFGVDRGHLRPKPLEVAMG